MPQKVVLGNVRRSDDKRKYFLSGHIDLPLKEVRPDKKIATNGTDASELMAVILDMVGYDGAVARLKSVALAMGLDAKEKKYPVGEVVAKAEQPSKRARKNGQKGAS